MIRITFIIEVEDSGSVVVNGPVSAAPVERPHQPASASLLPVWKKKDIDDRLPTSPDTGQHYLAKAEMAVILWLVTEQEGAPPFAAFGIPPRAIPAITPTVYELAEACRRLGFMRLAVSALGLQDVGEEVVSPWKLGGSTLSIIMFVYDRLVEGNKVEITRIIAQNTATAKDWNPEKGPSPCVDPTHYESLLGLGPFTRPDLDACPPLSPLKLMEKT